MYNVDKYIIICYNEIRRYKEVIQMDINTNLDHDLFLKIYPEFISTIITLATKGHLTSIKVLMLLIQNMDSYNSISAVIVSQKTLAAMVGPKTTQPTISNCIDELVEMKAIKVISHDGLKIYTINSNLIWKNLKDRNASFSKFSANVIISDTEHDKVARTRRLQGKKHIVKSISETIAKDNIEYVESSKQYQVK